MTDESTANASGHVESARVEDVEAQTAREEEEDLGVELRARAFSHSGPSVFLSFEDINFTVTDSAPGRQVPFWRRQKDAAPAKKKTILEDISGFIAPGELVALMGASGAGKTSLLNILAGKNKEYSGKVRVNGQRVSKQMRRSIAFCQQVRAWAGPRAAARRSVSDGLSVRAAHWLSRVGRRTCSSAP